MPTPSSNLQRLADSAGLKLATSLVSAVVLPLGGWFGSQMLNRLDRIEAQLASAQVDRATVQLRLDALERGAAERGAAIGGLRDRVLILEQQVQAKGK